MHAALMDVLCILSVFGNANGSHNLAVHRLAEPNDGVQRRAQLMVQISEEHRLCFIGIGQFGCPLLYPRLECHVQLPQLLLGALLRHMPARQGVGHRIESGSEMADFRIRIWHPHAGVVVAVTPLRGYLEQPLYRLPKKPAGSENCRQTCCQQTDDYKLNSTPG